MQTLLRVSNDVSKFGQSLLWRLKNLRQPRPLLFLAIRKQY